MHKRYRWESIRLFCIFYVTNTLSFIILIVSGAGLISIFSFGGIAFWAVIMVFHLIRIAKLRKKAGLILLRKQGCKQEFAEEVLQRNGRFAIYLRGFDYENEHIVNSDFNSGQGMGTEAEAWNINVKSSAIEIFINETFGENISLLALPDPRDTLPLPGANRFLNVPFEWQDFLKGFIGNAEVIFMYITSLSPGIKLELELLVHTNRSDNVIVIVGKELGAKNSFKGKKIMETLCVYKYIVFEHITESKSSRRSEKIFHDNILNCLLALQAANHQYLVRIDVHKMKFTFQTQSNFEAVLRYILGPMIWLTIAHLILSLIIAAWPSEYMSWKTFHWHFHEYFRKLPGIIVCYLGVKTFYLKVYGS